MIYDPALLEVRFVRRYQRFFAEFVTIDGQDLHARGFGISQSDLTNPIGVLANL